MDIFDNEHPFTFKENPFAKKAMKRNDFFLILGNKETIEKLRKQKKNRRIKNENRK